MPLQPTLTTARLVLRPFTRADAPAVQRFIGDARVADTTLTIPHPYLDGMAEAWIEKIEPMHATGAGVVFAVTEPGAGLVGTLSLQLEPKHHRAELGYWIAVPHWGKGYATEAVVAAIAFGFDTLGVNRIEAAFMPRNAASGRVMDKAGMQLEGRQRQYFCKNGIFEDVIRYAILREDHERARGKA